MQRTVVVSMALIAALCTAPSLASEQALPAESEGDLTFHIDVGRFRMGGGKSYVELYYTLPVADFSYVEEDDGGWTARFRTSFVLQRKGSKATVSDSWEGHFSVVDPDEVTGGQAPLMVDQMELENVSPGEYEISLAMTDLTSEKAGEVVLTVPVAPSSEELAVSDVELAIKIEAEADTSDSRFVKNGLYISPNPEHRFGGKFPILYWYSEIYGLTTGTEEVPDSFSIAYTICDSKGKEVRTLPSKRKATPGESAVEMGGVNVVALEAGEYAISLVVKDLSSGTEATASAPFYVEAVSDVGLRALSEEGEEEAPERDAAAELRGLQEVGGEWYERIEYLADRDELSLYESLSPEGKERFLVKFWKDRDPLPGTPRNELLEEFVRRIEYADEHFSSGFEKGHRSDRGRIYIKNGEPDEIERHPADVRYASYVSWLYYGRGGDQYIFIDRTGYGRYELVYSSDEDESFDPDWEDLIDPTVVRKRRR